LPQILGCHVYSLYHGLCCTVIGREGEVESLACKVVSTLAPGYPGSQRVLFSPLLNNPLVNLAGVFGFIPHITFKIGRKELIGYWTRFDRLRVLIGYCKHHSLFAGVWNVYNLYYNIKINERDLIYTWKKLFRAALIDRFPELKV
jgi:hypothetical protein